MEFMHTGLRLAGLFAVLTLASCAGAQRGDPEAAPAIPDSEGEVEAVSLLGEPLERPELPEETRAVFRANLDRAEADLAADPADEDAIIWVGRRLAYLGRFRDAIAMYSRGLDLHPGSHRLLRHRGHRYITVRAFDLARRDLARAASIVEREGVRDEIEPDGLPNAEDRPRSTTNANIYYHLGLARYLEGDYAGARDAYLEALEYSAWSDDMLVATAYWLYHTYRKMGERTVADALVRRVLEPEMDVIENHAYERLLRMYAGEITPVHVQSDIEGGAVDEVTALYGLANWHLCNGDTRFAYPLMRRVIGMRDAWPAFGYIASEAELARLGDASDAGAEAPAGEPSPERETLRDVRRQR